MAGQRRALDRRAVPPPSRFVRRLRIGTVSRERLPGPGLAGQSKLLHRHREHLLAGRIEPALAVLRRRLEQFETPKQLAPARRAGRYLHISLDQLDYAAAPAAELPVGSGPIESAHRHRLHQRHKNAAAWWLTTLKHMGHLLTARANGS